MTSRREEDLVMNDYGNEDEIYMVYKDREELKRNGLRLTPESKKNINPLSCFLACLPNNIQINPDANELLMQYNTPITIGKIISK